MNKEKQIELANKFQTMHKTKNMFILPNIWDSGSAVLYEKNGFEAIATTSAGIAYTLGIPDGENLDFEDLIYVIKKIQERINIPLSVDFERGYSDNPDIFKENAMKLIECGIVGFNLEEGRNDGKLDTINDYLVKIKILNDLKKETQIPFVINARTCVFWLDIARSIEDNLTIAIERGQKFAEAGANCIFIPGMLNYDTIAKIVEAIDTPINIVATPKITDLRRLNEIGVSRLSMGSASVRKSFAEISNQAQRIKTNDLTGLFQNSITYQDMNKYFAK
jgi:2-methylisocitrate lyase-like PEP mutase family enzyme